MKLKTLLSTTAVSALSLAPALAADVQVKAPLLLFTWTGFYAGANVGGVWARSSVTDAGGLLGPLLTPLPRTYGHTYSGVIGGLQVGYNWQTGSLVYGLEADIDFSSAKKSTDLLPLTAPGNEFHRSSLSALGTLRGRIGVALDRTLLYATGGVAYGWLRNQFVDVFLAFPATTIATRGSSAWGWTAGGGIEHAFGNNWSVKVEYLHVRFANEADTIFPGINYLFKFKDSASIARAGINYRF